VDLTDRPRLGADIELLRGMDDRPMAYDQRTGAYHRLSESALAMVRAFDGARDIAELAEALAARRHSGGPGDVAAARAEVGAFVQHLRREGVLDGAVAAPVRRRPIRARRSWLMPRIPLTRSLPGLLGPVARWLGRGRRAAAAMLCLSTVGVAGAAAGLVRLAQVPPAPVLGWATLIAVTVLVLEVGLHEAAHALVCEVLGVPVRAAGFALLLWVVPFAYVDRTDMYRVRSRRARISLALAGPLLDGWCMGLAVLVAALGHGVVALAASQVLALQVYTLAMNLNPVLAGDGYAAIEAGFGLVDPRGRALRLVRHLITRAPLPPHLATLRPWRRFVYVLYGVACAGYLALVAGLLLIVVLSRLRQL
jgi:putative peptide zinc metalloprotease protein